MKKNKNKLVIQILKALIGIGEVSTLLSSFIPAFKSKSILKKDGTYYLHGNFKLGGTISGRMSSNQPNLQNIPSSGTKHAKVFKQCFKAPEGYYFVGADSASLEDRISALTTKDSNKLKVYTDHYDGHCLRAYSYFGDKMPDIDPTSVDSINSIAKKYPKLRQDSKAPTFLLTYGGTKMGLIDKCGFTPEVAEQIEFKYHELYAESDKWVKNKLLQACKDGYVTLAFGLRLRTPILAQTVLNTRSTPYEAMSEGRTAGNALGQSYGLLNNRSSIEFMERVYKSKYRYDISPSCQIHDSQYYLIKATPEILYWVNINLIECMSWQKLPEIAHSKVGLGATLEWYYPSMADPVSIPNSSSLEEINSIINQTLEKYAFN